MTNQPLVSVIIPTYNRASLVALAIESVCNQTYPNIQLIVSDDGSTDNTAMVVERYADVQYIKSLHGGQSSARNHGLLQAKGNYIASLDSDDIWENDFLEKCIDIIENHQLDFVFANWMQLQRDTTWINNFSTSNILKKKLYDCTEKWIFLEHKELRDLYLTGCPSPSSSLIIKRSSIQTNWNSDMRIADDWCLLMDMIYNKSCKAAFTRQILWHKSIDGKNVYDGRSSPDITRDLWVHDIEKIFFRFKNVFSKKETKRFKKNQAYYLACHSYYQLTNLKQFWKGFKYFKRAMAINVSGTFSMLYKCIGKVLKAFFNMS